MRRFMIDTINWCGIPYVWSLLGEHVHQRHQVLMLVRHYDLVDVVQQDIAWALHGSIYALIKGGLLTEVVHITTAFWVQPATRWNHVIVDGPRNNLHKVLLDINLEQAVELWAAAAVVDHYSVHTKQSAEEKADHCYLPLLLKWLLKKYLVIWVLFCLFFSPFVILWWSASFRSAAHQNPDLLAPLVLTSLNGCRFARSTSTKNTAP